MKNEILYILAALKSGLVTEKDVVAFIKSDKNYAEFIADLRKNLSPEQFLGIVKLVESIRNGNYEIEFSENLNATLKIDTSEDNFAVDLASLNVTLEQPYRYKIKNEIGRGAIGRVVEVFDEHIGRNIAKKELLNNFDKTLSNSTAQRKRKIAISRFLKEARVTGQLEHPSIVPVYEIGRKNDGTIYYTMRMIKGDTLRDAIEGCETISEGLKLLPRFRDICNAIAYAHSRNVIHRDIKPDNIMIGEFGETVVLDWGLAKIKGQKDNQANKIREEIKLLKETSAGKTIAGRALGTPAYMSPEQALGEVDNIDELSDVYSLGVVLYEILSGHTPYKGKTALAVINQVLTKDPQPLSKEPAPPPKELIAIVEKAMKKDKKERYQSAKELAKDIESYLSGEKVSGYEYSFLDMFKLFAKKHKALIGAFGIIIMTIIASMIFIGVAYRKEFVARQKELRERLRAHYHLSQAFSEKSDRLEKKHDYLSAGIYSSASLFNNPACKQSPFYNKSFSKQFPLSPEICARASSVIYHNSEALSFNLMKVIALKHPVNSIAFSPNNSQFAMVLSDGTVSLGTTANFKIKKRFDIKESTITTIAFSPDGNFLAVGGKNSIVKMFNIKKGEFVSFRCGKSGITNIAFSQKNKIIAISTLKGNTFLFNYKNQKLLHRLRGHTDAVLKIKFTPNEKYLATASGDNTVILWNVKKGKKVHVFSGHTNAVQSLDFSPNGKFMATGSWDKDVIIWDTKTYKQIKTLSLHEGTVFDVSFSKNGKTLITAGADGKIFFYNTNSFKPFLFINAHESVVLSATLIKNNAYLVSLGEDNTLKIWKRKNYNKIKEMIGHSARITDVLYWNNKVFTASIDGKIDLWNKKGGYILRSFPTNSSVLNISLSPNEKYLASSEMNGKIILWNLKTFKKIKTIKAHKSTTTEVAFSPDSKYLASSSWDGTVKLWNVATGRLKKVILKQQLSIWGVKFSPDGKLLATAGADNEIRVFETSSFKEIKVLSGHDDWVRGLVFSRDSKQLFSSGKDKKIIEWDLKSGKEIGEFLGHTKWVNRLKLSKDGTILLSSSDDKTVRIWSVKEQRPLFFIRTASEAEGIDFSPDNAFIGIGDNKSLKLYPLKSDCFMKKGALLLKNSEKNAGIELNGFILKHINLKN